MELTLSDFVYLGRFIESFLFGLYSAIFAIYLQYHASKNDTNRTKNILFYALCTLYVLSAVVIIIDITDLLIDATEPERGYYMGVASSTIFGFCDFISQSILIYRCWIVWGCSTIHVVIIPSILAFTYLVAWVVGSTSSNSYSQGNVSTTNWGYVLNLTCLTISMVVNALVTGLIVLKIIKVFRAVRTTLVDQNLGPTGGSKLRSILFILIESGMILFSIQLTRLVVIIMGVDVTSPAYKAFELVFAAHEMLNGITPTVILVRVSMGLSFHDEDSMVEATMSLCFAPNHPTPLPEMGSMVHQDSEGRDNDIGI